VRARTDQKSFQSAIEIGGWTAEQLAARAWYTGGGESSHIRHIVAAGRDKSTHTYSAAWNRVHGRYMFRGGRCRPRMASECHTGPAASREPTEPDGRRRCSTYLHWTRRRHGTVSTKMSSPTSCASMGIEPRSPAPWQPQFDLAFEHAGVAYVVEGQEWLPVSVQQVRLGGGTIYEYSHLLQDGDQRTRPVLLVEAEPPDPWSALLGGLGITVIRADAMPSTLADMLQSAGVPEARDQVAVNCCVTTTPQLADRGGAGLRSATPRSAPRSSRYGGRFRRRAFALPVALRVARRR